MTPTKKTFFLAHSLSELKEIAWKLFSEKVRRGEADSRGYVKCVSCGITKHWKEGDAGHWPSIAGRNNSILFEKRGVHFQCKQCNIFKSGNPLGYDEYMKKRYGRKVMDELIKLKRQTVKYDKLDYIEMIDRFTQELNNLT